MCYCDKPTDEILSDIRQQKVPAEPLVLRCCWKRICAVKGDAGWTLVTMKTWKALCKRRGHLLYGHPDPPTESATH